MDLNHPYQGHYMEPAFLGFVAFASKNLMGQYVADEGKIRLGASPIDRMVDKAAGQDQAEAQRFVDWCVKQFGTPEQIGS